MIEGKEKIRQKMRLARSMLSPAERERLSGLACRALLASPLWKDAEVVALFVSLPEEISTQNLLESALREGKKLYLPRINSLEKGLMDFCSCSSLRELERGKFGLLEPQGQANAIFQPDLLIVPGLAFDRSGARLGYGGGYYDRYLGKRPQLRERCLGLAHTFQILDHLYSEKHDCKMAFLCTEEGLTWINI